MKRTNALRPLRRVVGEDGAIRPQLTSLVDMMTILLVFLLKSFSVEDGIVTPTADLQLPVSTSRDRSAPALSVEVTMAGVQLDGRFLVSLEDLASLPESEAGVPELRDELEKQPRGGSPGALTLQCDRRLDFRLLKRVMRTCSEAGYADFALLVRRETA